MVGTLPNLSGILFCRISVIAPGGQSSLSPPPPQQSGPVRGVPHPPPRRLDGAEGGGGRGRATRDGGKRPACVRRRPPGDRLRARGWGVERISPQTVNQIKLPQSGSEAFPCVMHETRRGAFGPPGITLGLHPIPSPSLPGTGGGIHFLPRFKYFRCCWLDLA